MNATMKMTCRAVLIATIAGGASLALANWGHHVDRTVVVTDIAATVAQYNYDAQGNVTGLLVENTANGTTSLLSFPKVCGGVSSIASPGASVTYSGRMSQATEPVSLVKITDFTPDLVLDTTTTTPYAETSGTVDRLNYDSKGDPNGFFFLPAGSSLPPVLVITGVEGFNMGITIEPGATLSVAGWTQVNSCAPADPVVVRATTLNGTRIHSGFHGGNDDDDDDHEGR